MKKTVLSLLLSIVSFGGFAQTPYTIYPIPHQQLKVDGTASFTPQTDVVAETGIDQVTRDRLSEIFSENGITANFTATPQGDRAVVWLGVNGSGEAADAKTTEFGLQRGVFSNSKFDRHIVALRESGGNAQVVVLGENTDAVFCGLASLEQMLDAAGAENMPCVTIYDYADIRERGVVEGYYGVPYSCEVTKDLFRFMARYKLNTYMYGAKSDPYHSQYWETPYPTSITKAQEEIGYLTQDMLKDITSESHRNKVNFIWAIHPGSAFTNSGNTTVVPNIMKKFEDMYGLGVRQFGVFVDDVGVPSDAATLKLNADRVTDIQNQIDAKWNAAGALPADTVKPLFFVPQLYVLSWSSVEGCRNFFGALSAVPSKVKIFFTGNGVWSVPNSTDLSTAKSYLGRNLAWWWNYPCNDNDATKLFPMDTYSNFSDEKNIDGNARMEQNLQGTETILSNPMQQGEVSKIALFSIADYAWNNSRFNNQSSWEASFEAVCGKEFAPYLRKLAPYLRYYDGSELATLISSYKNNASSETARKNLYDKVAELHDASQQLIRMKDSGDNSLELFYDDISPWLLCLDHMLDAARGFLDAADKDADVSLRWENYLAALKLSEGIADDADHQFNVLTGLGSGISLSVQTAEPAAKTLRPFIGWLSENVLKDIFPTTSSGSVKFITNSPTLYYNPITSSTGASYIYMYRAAMLQSGEYLGLSLPMATKLQDIVVSDTLAANNALFYSLNGKQWVKLEDEKPLDEFVKYIVIANTTGQPRSLKLNRDVFSVVMPTATKISGGTSPSADSFYDGHTTAKFYDGDYTTYTCIYRNQQSGDAYTLELSETTPIYDVRICMGTVNDDYMTVGRVQVSADGSSWTNIPVKGTNITNYRLTLSQNVKWSDEMTYCDFDGKGREAKYVRLYLYTPNTSKWLRLYEIEVNRLHLQQQFMSACTTSAGSSMPQATDGNPSTADAVAAAGASALYHFLALRQPQTLELFTSATSETPIYIEQSSDGENWTYLATQSSPYLSLDLSGSAEAILLRLIPLGAELPQIYEIKETTGNGNMPDVTSLPSLGSVPGCLPFALTDRKISFSSDVASYDIYTADGRRVVSSSRRTAVLPHGAVVILRLRMTDGTVRNEKLKMRN